MFGLFGAHLCYDFSGFSGLVWGSGSRVPAYFGPVLFDPCSAEVTPNNMSHNTSLLKDAGVSVRGP